MRFDSINLIGEFQVKGKTGSQNQFLGITNSVVGWITVTTVGGAGPQGPDGPPVLCVPADKIIIGNGSSFQYNGVFEINRTFESFNFGQNNSFSGTTLLSGHLSSEFGIINNSYLSTIIASNKGCHYTSNYSSVISSRYGRIICEPGYINKSSVILSSQYSIIYNSCNTSVISTYYNGYASKRSDNSIVVSGIGSRIYKSKYGAVLSTCYGYDRGLSARNYGNSVIGGYAIKTDDSKYSSVIGGENNAVCNSINSVILGGANNSICGSTNSIILGGANILVQNESNTTTSQRLININKVNFTEIASDPSPLEVGMLWYKDNQLWLRLGSTVTVSLIAI